jgi:hypothetical protein
MIAPYPSNRSKSPTQDRRLLSRYTGAGLWSDSSPGSSGSVAFSSIGNPTLRNSSALCDSLASQSYSGDFESNVMHDSSSRRYLPPVWLINASQCHYNQVGSDCLAI